MSNKSLACVGLALGFGLLVVAGATRASAEANCPQWSSPVCLHWSLGPPAQCTEWGCAADKKSDPPTRTAALNPTAPVRHPIGKPPIVTTHPVSTGTGAGTTTIYAMKGFSGGGGHGHH